MITTSIPTLETPRLRLRPLKASDFEDYAALRADPEVQRYAGLTWDRGRAWRHLAFLIGHWELGGAGLWAVEHKETGDFAGVGGFAEPEGWPGFELAGALARRFWRQGYAFEAGTAILDHGFNALGKDRIISLSRPENQPSIRAIERLGLRPEGRVLLLGDDLLIFSIDREAYGRRQPALLAS